MWFRSWLVSLKSTAGPSMSGRARPRAARKRPAACKLQLEALEDRTLLSTVALFDLAALKGSPFPSNRFTVPDQTQLTGLRVNLPMPDCAARPSDCEDLNVINTLDGFNLQPRLSIPFDSPIDPTSVWDAGAARGKSVFLVRLGGSGQRIAINQVVYDPNANTLHAEVDELLDQHARYALIVTNGVHDASGLPVGASPEFVHFLAAPSADPSLAHYWDELLAGLVAAEKAGIRREDIAVASVFTTQSATAVLEKIRDQILSATPASADFLLGPGGTRTVFPLTAVTGITFNQQIVVAPPSFNPVQLNVGLLRIIPDAVGTVAFGKYLSPDYEVHPGEYIPPVGTLSGTPVVQSVNQVYFNLFLPSGPKPAAGWPVAIFGHGGPVDKNGAPLSVVATMAAHGIATVAINAVGSGFGPLGRLTVNQTMGDPVTFPAGGRGIDQNGTGIIGNNSGQFATAPRMIISIRDALRQTVADLMQLVRVIEVGMAINGDGSRDLDPSRIYYFGQSFGGNYGMIFLAVEPDVLAGVTVVPGGSSKFRRLTGRPGLGSQLAARVPSLINTPGITSIDGAAVNPPFFNENLPLRDGIPLTVRLADGTSHIIRSPVINTVPGAMAIQEVLDNKEWVSLSGDPLGYVSHLRKDPLPGVPAKSVIFQFAKGDQSTVNPTATELLRAGDLADRATFYRNDLAFAEDPTVPRNPHLFMSSIASPNELVRAIARGAQEQIATFFASDGAVVIHPEPARFFETPINGPLPEGLNFIAVSRFVVSGFPSPTTAGTAGTFTVTAKNADGTTATNFAGTVHFTSSDPQAVLPPDYRFTDADAGVHTFSATLKTAGTQSLTATLTASISGTQAGIVVNPAAASQLIISAPASVPAGVAFSITVTAVDAYGNVATGYSGTVHFSSSDPAATLPMDYIFTAADKGVHTFSGLVLWSKAKKTITIIDTLDSFLTASVIVDVL